MNYSAVIIEISLAVLGILLMIVGTLLPEAKKSAVAYVSAFLLVCILIFSFAYYDGTALSFYKGLYTADGLSVFFKQIFIIAAILVTLMSAS
jgi:NADH-quinone oxidoreductase subunit N